MSTLVLNGSEISQVQFGPNEIASALYIGKAIGSVFTRESDERLFDILHSQFDVRITKIPPWLEGIEFSRTLSVHGQNLRRIDNVQTMRQLNIRSLQGIASLVILSSRYMADTSEIIPLLEKLLSGSLGTVVFPGQLDAAQCLPYTLKPLLANYIRATVDCDANSRQNGDAKTWMAELSLYIDYAIKLGRDTRRTHRLVAGFLHELLGGSNDEEYVTEYDQNVLFCDKYDAADSNATKVWGQRLHDTLDIQVAYVALVAAANGASLVVECITSTGKYIVPKKREYTSAKFVVRLWLCQPPPQLGKILRYEKVEHSARPVHTSGLDQECYVTVFGGQQEIAMSIAREVGYAKMQIPGEVTAAVNFLWNEGFEKG